MERCFSGAAAESSRKAQNNSALAATPTLPRIRSPRIESPRIQLLFERLVESIDSQSAEQLRVEVGGFLGHDLARESNITHLRDSAGIHQESDIGARSS